jgi:nucleoside-diphosphate-sugar epimerase
LRIFVTGANGFTGHHFVSMAVGQGHEVVPFEGNLGDVEGIKSQLRKAQPQWVVHLAAIAFVNHGDPGAVYDVNVVGTTNLLDALCSLEDLPSKVLLTSSANIYGNSSEPLISEEQAPAPVNHYAMSKLAMEYMARNYQSALPILFARPFNYTGAGQSDLFIIPKLVSHFVASAPFVELGNLDVEREFNDVRMVCDAYLGLLEAGQAGETYNICTGRPFSLREVISILEEITGHSPEIRVNPKFVRASEVRSLAGNPAKLLDVVSLMNKPDLRQTLEWMIAYYKDMAVKAPTSH